jgi:hypothetical protein
VNAGIVFVGLFTVVIAFIYGVIFGTKGRGSFELKDLLIVGGPVFVLLTLGTLFMAWGMAMP